MTTATTRQAESAAGGFKKDAAFKKPGNAPKSAHQIEYERRMTELDGRINFAKAKLDEVKGVPAGSGSEGGARGRVLDELKQAREQARPLQDQRRAWFKEASELRETLKRRSDELKTAKDKMPYKTIPEIDAKIAAYEHQLETSNFKLSEEKSIVSEISKLNKARRALSDLSGSTNDVLAVQARLEAVQEKIRGSDAANKATQEKLEALSAKLGEMNGARDAIKQTREERQRQYEKLRKDLDEAYEAKRKLFEENKAHRQAAFEARLKREARWKEEARCAEIEERIADLEERLQAYNPESVLDKKLAECLNLIAYFSGLSGKGEAAPATDEPANPLAAQGGRKVVLSEELANAVAIRKDDDEVYFAAGAGAKKKGAKKAGGAPGNESLPKLSIQVLAGLADLNLAIPSTRDQLPILLEAMEKIKAALLAKKDQVEASGQVELDPKQKALMDQIAALKLELDKPIEAEATA